MTAEFLLSLPHPDLSKATTSEIRYHRLFPPDYQEAAVQLQILEIKGRTRVGKLKEFLGNPVLPIVTPFGNRHLIMKANRRRQLMATNQRCDYVPYRQLASVENHGLNLADLST